MPILPAGRIGKPARVVCATEEYSRCVFRKLLDCAKLPGTVRQLLQVRNTHREYSSVAQTTRAGLPTKMDAKPRRDMSWRSRHGMCWQSRMLMVESASAHYDPSSWQNRHPGRFKQFPKHASGIFLSRADNPGRFTYENGRETEEGYEPRNCSSAPASRHGMCWQSRMLMVESASAHYDPSSWQNRVDYPLACHGRVCAADPSPGALR
jgi:hypothetical protein